MGYPAQEIQQVRLGVPQVDGLVSTHDTGVDEVHEPRRLYLLEK